MPDNNHTSLDVFVLCGGLGTRIRSELPDVPKVLAPIGETTYLDILLGKLKQAGFKRVILGIGYLGGQIEEYISSNSLGEDLEIVFSKENTPLGTGGAVKNAEKYIKSDNFMVINGDTLVKLDFGRMYGFHRDKNSILTIAVSEREKGEEGGSVLADESMCITGFKEKVADTPTKYVNAGVYIMRKNLLRDMGTESFSLETDFFPNILEKSCYAFLTGSDFLDIGTPEGYKAAPEY